MQEAHYLMLKQFIRVAFNDINLHKEYRDHASHRTMMYSYGRVVGAYAMIGIEGVDAETHEKVQLLEDCYNDAKGLTLHKDR